MILRMCRTQMKNNIKQITLIDYVDDDDYDDDDILMTYQKAESII